MAETELKVEVKETGPCERTVNVTVDPETVRKQRGKVITDFRKQAKIKGFRPGKAPRNIVVKMFADSIRDELLQAVVAENLQEAVKQEELRPLSRPEVGKADFGEDDTVFFEASFDVPPEINLKHYTGLKLEKKVREIKDEDIDRVIDDMREQHASFVPKDGAAEKGDYLLMDFCILNDDEEPNPETERSNQMVMAGHEDPNALFSHELVGKSEGENQIIEIDFPDDYPEESLKGKKVNYRVDVKGVRQKKLPEIDDHFAGQVGGAGNVAELKAGIRENMENEIEHRAAKQVEEELFRQIIEADPFDVPASIVDSAIRQQMDNLKRQGQQVDEEKFPELLRPSAEFMVRREYVIMEIVGKEKIEVGDEDIEKKIGELASRLGRTVDEVRRNFSSREAMGNLRSLVQEEKVIGFLMDNNKIKVVED